MTTVQHDNALGGARLSLSGVLAQSVGFMGPVFSLAALLPLIVGQSATGRGAGVATPLAIIIAGAGVFGAGWIIAQYAKRIHLCGSLYEYICDAAGPRAGIVAGWLYYGAMLILGVANFLVLGGQAQGFLQSAFNVNVPWWPLSLGFVVLVTAIVVIGVQFSVLALLFLMLVSAAAAWAGTRCHCGRSTRAPSAGSTCCTGCSTASTCSSGSRPPRTSPRRPTIPSATCPGLCCCH